MLGSSVVRDDGIHGTIVGDEEPGRLVVEFDDGTRTVVLPHSLASQRDGSYRLSRGAPHLAVSESEPKQIVIPVLEEELTVETHRVPRGKVRINKRVETREETVDAPVVSEQIVVEHIPVNKFVDDIAPEPREEDGILIIPMFEEILVVEKRLIVREEVRVFKRRTTTSTPQKVVLRREVVDIEREQLDGAELPMGAEDLYTQKEKQQ